MKKPRITERHPVKSVIKKVMKKTFSIIAPLAKTIKRTIVILVAIVIATINAQAQERLYTNKELGVSYQIPENFIETKSATKNSVLRLKSIEEQNQVKEIKFSFIRYTIPANVTSWDDDLLATLKEMNDIPQVKLLYKHISYNKHIVSTKGGKRRCIKIIRKSNVLQSLSEMEYVFVLKEGVFTVTIYIIEDSSGQIHNYENYINNLTVESK